jgi:hypothetical protein
MRRKVTMHTRYEAAFTKKQAASPNTAMSPAAMAGPTRRATLFIELLSPIAPVRSASPTIS